MFVFVSVFALTFGGAVPIVGGSVEPWLSRSLGVTPPKGRVGLWALHHPALLLLWGAWALV